ncbi:hypothetical protein PHLCEN_2v5207 [Hermanssonia centrifuga]|uniref:Uncharacterized protein n=1 Tax=Hermanssonia centrifuga TaxID=98765 RepID=A0A2R6P8Q0_9APHY|nr:hypothetical protein PHLCEN_2v5207 [Hermanssonia centrifuga]
MPNLRGSWRNMEIRKATDLKKKKGGIPTESFSPISSSHLIRNHKESNYLGDLEDTAADFQIGSNKSQAPFASTQENTTLTHDSMPQLDDIKIKYHPNSSLATRINHFEDYNQEANLVPVPESDWQPWFPYRHLQDFVACELALESCMNEGQIDCMLNLINSTTSKQAAFSLRSYSDTKKG